MNVRWMAVLTGFFVDIAISALLSLLATPQFYTAPNLAQPGDLLLLGLLALSTGIGGFVAGRMAGESRTINGLLVAVMGILVNQLGPPLPRVFVDLQPDSLWPGRTRRLPQSFSQPGSPRDPPSDRMTPGPNTYTSTGCRETVLATAQGYFPRQLGVRFSRNAHMPSWASSSAAFATITWLA